MLIAMMRLRDNYIENHLGGAAIMKCRPTALSKIGIDRYDRALERLPCEYPVELIHGCAHRFLVSFAYQGREPLY